MSDQFGDLRSEQYRIQTQLMALQLEQERTAPRQLAVELALEYVQAVMSSVTVTAPDLIAVADRIHRYIQSGTVPRTEERQGPAPAYGPDYSEGGTR